MSAQVAEHLGPPEEPAGEQPTPVQPRWRAAHRWSAFVPWGLFAVALAAAVMFAVLWQGAKAADRRRAEVASSAGRFLTALTNFRGESIGTDVEEIRSFAVGDFARQVDTFFDQQTQDALRKAGAQSVGRVHSIFVESISGDSATVFGVVDESVTNAAASAPRTEVLRIEIDMIHAAGGWKVERVNILQSPTSGPFGPGG